MEWAVIYWSVMLFVQMSTITFHTCGLYLLQCLRRSGRGDVQLLLVMNLSVSEILLNVTYALLFTLNISFNYGHVHLTALYVMRYIEIFSSACVNLVYYSCMIYIAVNKMLEVFLNLKYHIYCKKKNVLYLLSATWVISFMTFIAFSVLERLIQIDYHGILTYFYTSVDFIFILIVCLTHSYIFRRYRKSRVPGTNCPLRLVSKQKHKKISILQTFQNSRFYISCVLIVTFILFTIVPKLLAFFVYPSLNDVSLKLISGVTIGILYHISFIVDAFIYVFMLRPVKQLLLKKIRKLWKFKKDNKLIRKEAVRSKDRSVDGTPLIISTYL